MAAARGSAQGGDGYRGPDRRSGPGRELSTLRLAALTGAAAWFVWGGRVPWPGRRGTGIALR